MSWPLSHHSIIISQRPPTSLTVIQLAFKAPCKVLTDYYINWDYLIIRTKCPVLIVPHFQLILSRPTVTPRRTQELCPGRVTVDTSTSSVNMVSSFTPRTLSISVLVVSSLLSSLVAVPLMNLVISRWWCQMHGWTGWFPSASASVTGAARRSVRQAVSLAPTAAMIASVSSSSGGGCGSCCKANFALLSYCTNYGLTVNHLQPSWR